jgi:hypothetical protein
MLPSNSFNFNNNNILLISVLRGRDDSARIRNGSNPSSRNRRNGRVSRLLPSAGIASDLPVRQRPHLVQDLQGSTLPLPDLSTTSWQLPLSRCRETDRKDSGPVHVRRTRL